MNTTIVSIARPPAAAQGIDAVALTGFLAALALLLCYTHQHQGRRFVIGCALSATAAAVYGFLQGAWPLGIVMAAWAGIALRRAFARKPESKSPPRSKGDPEDEPVALNQWHEESRLDRLFGRK